MIGLILDFISGIISLIICIWIIIYIIKSYLLKSKKTKKEKELKKIVEIFENKWKSFSNIFFLIIAILLKASLSTLLAIGIKPIIYKLNSPLGEGYTIFASYMIAIMLYIILPDIWKPKKTKGGKK